MQKQKRKSLKQNVKNNFLTKLIFKTKESFDKDGSASMMISFDKDGYPIWPSRQQVEKGMVDTKFTMYN